MKIFYRPSRQGSASPGPDAVELISGEIPKNGIIHRPHVYLDTVLTGDEIAVEVPASQPTHGWRGDTRIGAIIVEAVHEHVHPGGYAYEAMEQGIETAATTADVIRLAKAVLNALPAGKIPYRDEDLRRVPEFRNLVFAL
jgi:hypothetical protein